MPAGSYQVDVRYVASDHASGAIEKIGRSARGAGVGLDSLHGIVGEVTAGFDKLASAALTVGTIGFGAALTGGIMAVKTGLTGFNSVVESSQIAFAGLFRMFGAAPNVEVGLGAAKKLTSEIYKDAAALPGEFTDFVDIAQTLASPLLHAGRGIEEIRDMTRQTAIAAAMTNVPFSVAGREMTMMLEGWVTRQNVLARHLGISAKSVDAMGRTFKDMTTAQRIDFINERLKTSAELLPLYEKSWQGLTTTLISSVKSLLGRATLPLFDALKKDFADMITFLDSGRAKDAADEAGGVLLAIHDKIRAGVEWIGAHWSEIKDDAVNFARQIADAFERVWPLVQRIGGYLAQQAKDPAGFLEKMLLVRGTLGALSFATSPTGISMASKLFGGGGGAAAVSAGGKAITNVSQYGIVAKSEADIAAEAAFGGQTGIAAAAPAAEGGAGGLAAASSAAGPLAVALIALIGAVDTVTMSEEEHNSTLHWMGNAGKEMWREVRDNFGAMWGELKVMFEDIWASARPLVDLMGIALFGAIDGLIYVVRAAIWPFKALARAIRWVLSKIPGSGVSEGGAELTPGTGAVGLDVAGGAGGKLGKAAGRQQKELKAVGLWSENIGEQAEVLADAQKKMGGAGKTNITNRIFFSILSEQDPERLARSVATHLDRELKRPRRPLGSGTFVSG